MEFAFEQGHRLVLTAKTPVQGALNRTLPASREACSDAETLLGAMTGISRSMLETGARPNAQAAMQKELMAMARACLAASAA